MAVVPAQTDGAANRHSPQQAGVTHILVHGLRGLSRKRQTHRHQRSRHEKHRFQLYSVSIRSIYILKVS